MAALSLSGVKVAQAGLLLLAFAGMLWSASKLHSPEPLGTLVLTIDGKSLGLFLHNDSALMALYAKSPSQTTEELISLLRQMYSVQQGRPQPAEFDHWWHFAIQEKCMLDGYEQIYEDLQIYRDEYSGAMPRVVLQETFAMSNVRRVQFCDGKMRNNTDLPDDPSARIDIMRIDERWEAMTQRFVTQLPDMEVAIGRLDEPLTWRAPLPIDAERKAEDGVEGMRSAFHQWGCDSCTDIPAETREMFKGFGMFVDVMHPPERPKMLRPIFAHTAMPSCCFGDIAAPGHYMFFRQKLDNGQFGSQDSRGAMCLGDQELRKKVPRWRRKKTALVWRGTTTGGRMTAVPGVAMEHQPFMRMHRPRLVRKARELNSSLLDVRFTGYLQCGDGCAMMEQAFGPPAAHLSDSQVFSYKYLLVVGGNSFASRLGRYLCSDSLVFMTNILGEWYHRGLQPYVHYVPVKPDYSNLLSQVQWAVQHDRQARKIVSNGNQFVRRYLTAEAIECYMYRLLLEYKDAVGTNCSSSR